MNLIVSVPDQFAAIPEAETEGSHDDPPTCTLA